MHANQHKTETLNARIEPALKNNAERILKKLGLSNAEAIRLFYTQICLNKGLPFDIKIPNKTTLAAMQELENGNAKKFNSVKELFKDLDD
ncbi:MAG: type II toxin-antitoxin system RelB/DinJ family antitoxin [Gammaproteobacteria bacterium]|jgi:DNA-damage-inducible protein J